MQGSLGGIRHPWLRGRWQRQRRSERQRRRGPQAEESIEDSRYRAAGFSRVKREAVVTAFSVVAREAVVMLFSEVVREAVVTAFGEVCRRGQLSEDLSFFH